MNNEQRMIAESADALFSELGPNASFEADWPAIEALGFPDLMLGKEDGGIGGCWRDAQTVFRLAGYHALALPLVEATIARHLAGNEASGLGTIVFAPANLSANDQFTGIIAGVPWGRYADYVLMPSGDGRTLLLSGGISILSEGANAAGEPRDTLWCDGSQCQLVGGDVIALGAMSRAAQISGALDAALALSVEHVNQRQQFGKPLGKLQAVQQALATFAVEAAAANCAAMGAAQAADSGDAAFEAGAAKLRASQAAATGSAVAHQVHGAIGFTSEYALHPLTRRLWAWSSEFGGQSHWADRLGRSAMFASAESLWAGLVDRHDRSGRES